jgi:hypothetical protein
MNRGEEAIDRVRKAGDLLAKAEERWNAGSPAVVEECIATLEESAAELCAAQETAAGRADSLRGLSNEILQIRERVVRIERLSDLAAAFLRGGSPSMGGSPLYRADGFEDTDSSLTETTRIQA